MITKNQAEVIRWWHSGCDYHQGVMFFARFSRNKTLIHTFMRKQPCYGQQKLNYELPKAVQLDWRNMPSLELAEKFLRENQNGGAQSGEKTPAIIRAEFSAAQNNPDWSRDTDTLLRFSKNIPLVSEMAVTEYPKIIRRIKYRYSSLYKTRSILQREMADVAPENTPENRKKRASLFTRVKELSIQMDYYYQFIWEYENTGTVPAEEKVQFPKENGYPTGKNTEADKTNQSVPGELTADVSENKSVETSSKLPLVSIPETIGAAPETNQEETDKPSSDEVSIFEKNNIAENNLPKTTPVKSNNPAAAEVLDKGNTPVDTVGLKRRKKNLQTANTKDKNLLLFQDKSRQEKENPMPEGPKRQKIELRIKGREKEITEIEVQLANAEAPC